MPDELDEFDRKGEEAVAALNDAAKRGFGSSADDEAIWQAVLEVLDFEHMELISNPFLHSGIAAMLAADRERAIAELTTPEWLRPHSFDPHPYTSTRSLFLEGVRVPEEVVLPIVSEVVAVADVEETPFQVAELLQLAEPSEAVAEWVQRLMREGNGETRRRLAPVAACCRGLDPLVVRHAFIESLPAVVNDWCQAFPLISVAGDGGFDYWATDKTLFEPGVRALRAAGADEMVAVLLAARAADDLKETSFEVGSEVEALSDEAEVSLWAYAAEHASIFNAAVDPSRVPR